MSADTANAVTAPARTVEAADDAVLRLVEVVLTAEVYNQHPNLDLNDLPPHCREVFGVAGATEAKRPVAVSEAMIKKALGYPGRGRTAQEEPVRQLRGVRPAPPRDRAPRGRPLVRRGGAAPT